MLIKNKLKEKITNLGQVKNVTSLNELALYDDIIRKTCKRVINPIEYDDIVNDMYLKLDKYLKKGKIINGGYILLAMRTINLNILKKNKIEEDVTLFNILDEAPINSEDYYIEIDTKIDVLDEFLSSCLNDSEIALFKFYKINSLKITAIFYNQTEKDIRLQIKKIRRKICDNGGFNSII